jgi:serine/threonine-protein kinase
VSIKFLTAVGQQPDQIERFRNEARIHHSLYHPGIATLYDYLEVGGVPCLVMEWVDGPPLLEWAAGRTSRDIVWCFGEIACGLAYLHARHVVHRDIKPANIRIGRDGRPRLLDFGIAHDYRSPKLTTAGMVTGTVEYMAPELLRGGDAAPQSDVWAWGISLYEVLTGHVPFSAGTHTELCRRIAHERPSGAGRSVPGLPPACDALLLRCLEKQPRLRPANGNELVAAVDAILGNRASPEPSRFRPKPIHWVAGGAVAMGLAAGVATLVTAPPGPGHPTSATFQPAGSRPVSSEIEPAPPPATPPQTMVKVRFEGMYGQRDIFISGHKIGTTDFNHEFEYGQKLDVECRSGNQTVQRRTLDVGLQTNLTCTQ